MTQTTTSPSIQDALSALLLAEGFLQMSKDVLHESDKHRLSRYARVALNNAPQDQKIALKSRLCLAGLL